MYLESRAPSLRRIYLLGGPRVLFPSDSRRCARIFFLFFFFLLLETKADIDAKSRIPPLWRFFFPPVVEFWTSLTPPPLSRQKFLCVRIPRLFSRNRLVFPALFSKTDWVVVCLPLREHGFFFFSESGDPSLFREFSSRCPAALFPFSLSTTLGIEIYSPSSRSLSPSRGWRTSIFEIEYLRARWIFYPYETSSFLHKHLWRAAFLPLGKLRLQNGFMSASLFQEK